ncbi:MAG: PstS family phosphate ABC transporter substrate-binding protein [archaeon]
MKCTAMFVIVLVVLSAGLLACTTQPATTGQVVVKTPAAQPVAQIQKHATTEITIKGSDTLLQLVSNLAEAYSAKDPLVKISVTGGGSGTGIAALLNDEIRIATSSRLMKDEEYATAKQKGISISQVMIARDMLSVIVHKDNPVQQLTMDQISKIYKGDITNWKAVGGMDKKITLYGRQSSSGTYAFFMEDVVKSDYSQNMRNMEGNQAIVDAVRQDTTGIGYVGLGYAADENGQQVSGIHVIKVAKTSTDPYLSPLDPTKHDTYPVSRSLNLYVTKDAAKAFLLFSLSAEGQQIAQKAGFIPLSHEDIRKNVAVVESLG